MSYKEKLIYVKEADKYMNESDYIAYKLMFNAHSDLLKQDEMDKINIAKEREQNLTHFLNRRKQNSYLI